MLARLAAAVVCVVTQQAFAESASLVGSWHADDGRTYYEVHFRPDHTFTLFARMSTRNPELAVARMGEQFGTWQIAADRVVLASTEVSPKRQSRVTLRFRLSDDSLRMQRFYDTPRTDTYRRLHLPMCAEFRSAAHVVLDERTLIGRWRGHYRTHDTEFSFEPDRRVTLYSWDLGDRRKFEDATWHFSRGVITIKPGKDSLMSDSHIRWRIIRTGSSCLVVTDGSEMSYTLRRVE
jgi:hypothetical protein